MPKKKEKEIQCRRCQIWGHIAKNCSAEYKCVKCKQPHLPGECPRNVLKDTDPCCVNCGETGHPANWRGCPFFKKYLENKKERMRKDREAKLIASANVNRAIPSLTVSPGTSFARVLHPDQNSYSQQNSQNKPPVIDEFLKLANFFMEPELTLEQEINKFLSVYRNMPKIEAKAEFLRLFNKVKSTYGP